MADQELLLTVSEFVAYLNQTLEYAYPSVSITGELANFRVSKNRWVYFDLKDEEASVRFFGTVYNLRGPMEDGMMLKVRGTPRLHPLYGFSITVQQIELVGEGTIKRASELLQAKLQAEGLFDPSRKRMLPYPPRSIGLITSTESAAYADFTKIINARWQGLDVQVADVQVQGVSAPTQIIQAVQFFNQHPEAPDVLVLIRGGGSPEDLQAFSDESVVRAVAASRVPTLVAIGHEIDISLAELAADQRASTPSNAAELLVPDKAQIYSVLEQRKGDLKSILHGTVLREQEYLTRQKQTLTGQVNQVLDQARRALAYRASILEAFNPQAALERGYAVLKQADTVLGARHTFKVGDIVDIETFRADLKAEIQQVKPKKERQ
jgi:exodeoxyribonuclease VII large subunit